jgi:hypothetical protein
MITARTSLSFFAAFTMLGGCIASIDVGHNDRAAAGSGAGTGGGVGGGASTSTGSTSGAGVGGGACVPVAEICTTPADENCDGLTPDCSGAHLWSDAYGDKEEQVGGHVATDDSGNVYLTGYFQSEIDLGGGALKATGTGYDVYVAKFDGKGSHVWSKSFPGAGDEIASSVAVDEAGNVYLTGNFDNTIDFGPGQMMSTGGTDVYLAKLSGSNGSTLWANRYGDTGNSTPRGLTIDGNGNMLLVGYYTSGIKFGGGNLASTGGNDIFVAKFNGSGVHQWSNRYGDSNYQEAYGVAVDSSNNVIVAGRFAGSVTFGSLATMTSAGITDAFVVKLNSSGVPQWSKRYGDGDQQSVAAVAVDSAGSVLFTGAMVGAIDLGGGTRSGMMYAAKIDASGNHLWSKGYSAGRSEDITVDDAGNVVLVGSFSGTLDPGVDSPLTSAGMDDALAMKLDGTTGSSTWAHRYGDTSDQAAFGVAVDVGANVYLTGSVEGSINTGGGSLTSAGGRDAWIAKLAP